MIRRKYIELISDLLEKADEKAVIAIYHLILGYVGEKGGDSMENTSRDLSNYDTDRNDQNTKTQGAAQSKPELPILKNKDQRSAFLDAYDTWPLWIETKETGERYYRYDLADGTSMIIKVYRMLIPIWNYEPVRATFVEGYGRREYYLLQDGRFFRDCEASRSVLIDKLKDIQKVKKDKGKIS